MNDLMEFMFFNFRIAVYFHLHTLFKKINFFTLHQQSNDYLQFSPPDQAPQDY
jgi:hypothetical protein